MKKRNLFYWIGGIAFAAIIVFAIVKIAGKNNEKELSDPSLFSPYISGYTSGVVSKHSVINIELTTSFAQALANEKTIEELFEFYPKVNGKVEWVNEQTIQFIPEESLVSGETYIVEFNLSKLKENLEENLETFVFKIMVRQQNFDLAFDELITTDMEDFLVYDLIGTLKLADAEESEDISEMLNASIDGDNLNIVVEKRNSQEFEFRIVDIPRFAKEETLKLKYDGAPIGLEKNGNIEYQIPAIGVNAVLQTRVIQYPEQYVLIQFSNPLKETQYLDGLVRLEDTDARIIIRNNIVKYIPVNRLEGDFTLKVHEGIVDLHNKKLDGNYREIIHFEARKPELRLVHSGVIMPSTEQGLVFPFDAVNLKAVDVQITKIYENNVLQFLQQNSFDGDYEITRVGKPVKQTSISLEQSGVVDFGKWNRFTLDLNSLIKTEPGAIYQIEIGFRKQHAIYPCQNIDSITESASELTNTLANDDIYFWKNEFTNYTYGDYYYYDWNLDEDPCSDFYYGYKNAISSNIFASDIGLTAKKGQGNEVFVVTTNLLTTMPIKRAKITVYNYQQQLIGEGATDKNGFVTIPYDEDEEAFFIVAEHESQKAYLKLNYGETLSLSEFDVYGAENNGTKAYVFGERGVWRPGDSIFLSIIIQDDINMIPEGHPVVLELTNPRGQMVYREVQNKNIMGYHTFRFKTENSDPTGNYSAKITVGGNMYWKTLPVETIKPNRLRIELDFSKEYLSADGDVTTTLTANWLHGAVAKDLEATINVSLFEATTSFKDYDDFQFTDVSKNFSFNTLELFSGKTDVNGQISQTINFDIGTSAPGICRAVLSAKVFEKGGNFSVEEQSILFQPYSSYIGMKIPAREDDYYLKGDKTYAVDIVIVDKDGKRIDETRNVEVTLFDYEYSWWYDTDNDRANFASSNYNNAISRKTVNIENGKGSSSIKFPNVDYGDFLIYIYDPVSKHSCSQIVYVSDYSYRSYEYEEVSGPQMLNLVPENDTVMVGEDIIVKLPEVEGRALVTVENGNIILSAEWVEVNKKDTEFRIKANGEMAPNVYINVSLIQPHSQTKNDHPIRLYGVIPIWVEDPDTHLHPVLKMPDELEAESKVKIEVTEKDGKPMAYTIAMVDEGLLNLTHFNTPDPWSHFYSRDALGVTTWDIYDWVIGAFGSKIERLLSIGGGGSLNDVLDPLKANRFKPMVKFIGPFYLEKGKTATHTIQLPQYIGSVRTMIIVADEHAYGSAEKTTAVTKPLMLLGSLPRVLSPQEEVIVPVTLFAMNPAVKSVVVEIETNDLLSVVGNTKQTISFDKEGEKYLKFTLKVNDRTGVATVKLKAKSGMFSADYDMELNVRYPNPPTTRVIANIADKGVSFTEEFDALGLPGTNTTTLEVYSIPPLNLENRLEYLIRYPHGCIEQTVSAAFPQLYLSLLLDLNEKQQNDIQEYVNRSITKLCKYQLSNGGFSYWPGSDNVSFWGTNYVGHFLLEAKNAGYEVPSAVLNKWVSYQQTKASSWTDDGSDSQLVQAYRLYTLALSGNPDKGAMNRFRQQSNLSSWSLWRLAAAYQLIGKESIAEQIVSALNTQVKEYNQLGGSFGSGIRDKAMILETLVLLGKTEDAFKLVLDISDELCTERWMSTQTTAYALLAVSKYVKDQKPTGEIMCSANINGITITLNSDKPVLQHVFKVNETSKNTITINNTGESMLYFRIVESGIPKLGSETDDANDLQMDVSYSYLDGTVIDPTEIEQGTDFVATIKVKPIGNRNYYDNIALTQMFPSGWEIINQRMTTTDLGEQSYADYLDIRDDRIYTYFGASNNKTKTYKVLLNASFAGKYYLPAVNVEAMYDHTIFARKKGQWVEVKSVY